MKNTHDVCGTVGPVIMRRSTAHVVPDRLDDFVAYLVEQVRGFPAAHPGLLDHRILRSTDAATVVYESTWASAADLERFAGPGWAAQPVMLPGEEVFLERPLAVEHLTEVPIR
jgi:hypothetical protein